MENVHDTQRFFRKILHSMSHPGMIVSTDNDADELDFQASCYQATMGAALTLLDAEVTFHVIPGAEQDVIDRISAYTLAAYAPIEQADFVFVLQDASEQEIITAMEKCKNGTLIDPEGSATWIMESPFLVSEEDGWMLKGPGIRTTALFDANISPSIAQTRNKRIREYPLGIDIIFVEETGNIASIPRTTSMELLEVK